MQKVNDGEWARLKELISAANIINLKFLDTLSAIQLELVYGLKEKSDRILEYEFTLNCYNCLYIDIKRVNHHDSGASIIYDANLYLESDLITKLFNLELDSPAGNLKRQELSTLYHLEIIGEVSLNIICEEVKLTSTL